MVLQDSNFNIMVNPIQRAWFTAFDTCKTCKYNSSSGNQSLSLAHHQWQVPQGSLYCDCLTAVSFFLRLVGGGFHQAPVIQLTRCITCNSIGFRLMRKINFKGIRERKQNIFLYTCSQMLSDYYSEHPSLVQLYFSFRAASSC